MVSDQVVLDSSIFVAFYWEKDTQHAEAVRIMEEIASAPLIVHPYVIQEVTTVLATKLGLPTAKKFLADVSGASNITIAWVNIKDDIAAFDTLSKPLSFTDTALIRLAKIESAQLLTFDRKMLSLFHRS